MTYQGSCHCGAVEFTVQGEVPTSALSCNCSHCRRKGLLLTFVPADQFTLDNGEDVLEDYLFNQHKITHRFCGTCGSQPFAEGKGPDGAETRAVNLRCVPEADLDALELQKFDGAAY
jgi:hypothetical protein